MIVFSGKDRGSSDTSRMRRRRSWEGFAGAEDTAAAIGVASVNGVFAGVMTGVLVWTITRILDRTFKLSR